MSTPQGSLKLGLTEQFVCPYCTKCVTEEDINSGKVTTEDGSIIHTECALDKHFDAFEI